MKTLKFAMNWQAIIWPIRGHHFDDTLTLVFSYENVRKWLNFVSNLTDIFRKRPINTVLECIDVVCDWSILPASIKVTSQVHVQLTCFQWNDDHFPYKHFLKQSYFVHLQQQSNKHLFLYD